MRIKKGLSNLAGEVINETEIERKISKVLRGMVP